MALQLSRPDPASPDDVAAASFATTRKGYDPREVREFLRMVAAELARLHERERALEQQLRDGQRTAFSIAAADDEVITRLVGDEASRILQSARDAAARLKAHTEEAAERMLREAGDEARRIREETEIEVARRRSDTSADLQSELEMARQQGREMVDEAREYRERVLADVARRRELARRQIEQIVHGRARLIQAFERSRAAAEEALAELGPLVEPAELDLSPTTGPVPVTREPHPEPTTSAPAVSAEPEAPVAAAEPELPSEPSRPFDHSLDPEFGETPPAHAPAAVVELPVSEFPAIESALAERDERRRLEADDLEDSFPDGDLEVDDDDREPAPVVELFTREPVAAADTAALVRPSVDDLFAKLRAARTSAVAERAAEAVAPGAPETPSAASAPGVDVTEPEVLTEPGVATEPGVVTDPRVVTEPEAEPGPSETPFTRRDDALAPLVAAAARKLKRALADEQNEVLHTLRGRQPIDQLGDLVGIESVHHARYIDAISGELTAAAVAGAMSMGATAAAAQKSVKRSSVIERAGTVLVDDVLRPLRERQDRCLTTAGGDRDEVAALLRPVYREWKNQRIDEHLDDVLRVAFGHGALAGVASGTPIRWAIDPAGPECADAEDNTLGGVVAAGDVFPTEHACAPAHPGCRCMIVPADT